MCGRFVGFQPIEVLQQYFPIDCTAAEVTANYNVAPSPEVLTIVRREDQNWLERLHWGLVPFWAKDPAIGNRLINARAETVAAKPTRNNSPACIDPLFDQAVNQPEPQPSSKSGSGSQTGGFP